MATAVDSSHPLKGANPPVGFTRWTVDLAFSSGQWLSVSRFATVYSISCDVRGVIRPLSRATRTAYRPMRRRSISRSGQCRQRHAEIANAQDWIAAARNTESRPGDAPDWR
jgi:hypothetical protein